MLESCQQSWSLLSWSFGKIDRYRFDESRMLPFLVDRGATHRLLQYFSTLLGSFLCPVEIQPALLVLQALNPLHWLETGCTGMASKRRRIIVQA